VEPPDDESALAEATETDATALSPSLSPTAVRDLLSTRWGVNSPTVDPLDGPGICSETWSVVAGRQRWVAKAVPSDQSELLVQFERGLGIAETLAEAGFRTGAPTRTGSGNLVEPLEDWYVGLLRFEEGRTFSLSDLDGAQRIGNHVGKLHSELQRSYAGLEYWDPAPELIDRPYVGLRPGLAEVAAEVVNAALEATAASAIGLIHGDLEADEILIAADGSIAIVDWGSVEVAPLILDLLTFHDKECFGALTSGYTAVRPEAEVELRALPELERLHWLRQTAFWGGRVIEPFRDAEQRQGFPNVYGFERSYEILTTGRWRP
jgi:Ser/Thr protein kinase RdoA (MazF antagonist)